MQRSIVARKNRLVLRLQQTQRQMKEYIQATTMSNPAELGGGSIVTATSNLLEGVKDKCDTTKVNATKRKTSKVSQATYYNFQKEIKTQSTVIAASREENGRLKQQLKQVRQDDRYDRLKQMKMLRDKVSETGTLGGNSGLTSKPQYRVAVKARSEGKTCALASQKDLVTTQLSYQQKLNEVVLELDRVKKAKIELECCYEGVDLTQAAQEMQHAFEPQGELELSELELCEKKRAHALVALQKSLSWYLEKQRLLDDQNEELRRLRRQAAPKSLDFQTGTSSMNQRANAEPCGPYSNLPLLPLSIDIRRIQRVDDRLAELEQAMRWRHPDTFSNLSLASRRIDDDSMTLVLHRDYDRNRAIWNIAHEASEVKLASGYQREKKLLLQYRRKSKEQEKQIKQLNNESLFSHRPTIRDSRSTYYIGHGAGKSQRLYTDKIEELKS
ncbi:hypothetical protein KXD40_001715 [Peronospora effusa]|uniref:Centrosomal protein of 162 kDa n=1 Tax=Peronospora effusa TaxID=542832 RepID=A0A3M6VWX3_9STRA|nr:hypothetical protein DD238_000054 [Peronospora effusa]RQM08912.1 hypothetical protein DD237_000645 [Peronospora effusa]UIZ26055.1 hypothetical protein KXD40_001715 [Peronospora effusa]